MAAVPSRQRGRPLGEIETWIFDLDNTLYPSSCRLFDQIHARMTEFIALRLDVSAEAALLLQKRYFREHGTTMRGLMVVEGVDPEEFLAYVHEVDLACVPPDPTLAAALARLPGRKIVHTNGSRRHAERLLAHLDIAGAFSGIFDIKEARWEPKPAPSGYRELIRRHGVDPAAALMVEDIAKNLVPAAELGMTTAWVKNGADWAVVQSEGEHIHHVVEDLARFLAAAIPAGTAA